ncbi:hypothetical protein FSARC_5755 [Fusarium sarcochroum]|uniref:N-acetyltransferase domain-containing protein n=1 Tax=Fusarium sarcochroum TaxID=1208366 RepID=A0A8H4TYQ6_9HYPO|nr:hypothetical protein FSARC_5755 [Fusarium sarcochroum]
MASGNIDKAFQSERLVFRTPENNDEDRDFLFTHLENDPLNASLGDLNLLRPKTKKSVEEFIVQMQKATLPIVMCLSTEEAKKHDKDASGPVTIGYMVLGWGGKPPNRDHHRNIAIGLTIAEPFQNKGYGGETINWALDWAFRFGGYHRVSLGTVAYNHRAQHLYKKLGFVEEGRRREVVLFDRKWYDVIDYGMLEHEWEALRGLK